MKAIQDVPYDTTVYMAIWFERGDGSTIQTGVEANAAAVRAEILKHQGNGWRLADRTMRVYRMKKELAREVIEASIRRKQGKRTLLTVQAQNLFTDDLNVKDYWQEDWALTARILKDLDSMIL